MASRSAPAGPMRIDVGHNAASSTASSRPRLRLVRVSRHEPAVPAVLAVATGAEEQALAVFPELVARKVSPCLVAGIEDSADALTLAVDRASGPTLFVVCVTPQLRSDAVPPIVQAFGRRRRPFHKLLVLDRHEDEAFVEEIAKAAAELLAPEPVPTFPELEGFMTGSAEASTTHGESKTERIAGYTVRAPVAAVVVEGQEASSSFGMRDRIPSGGPKLRVLEGGAAEDDVDTAQLSVMELPTPDDDDPVASTKTVWRPGRVEIAAASAFALGLAIVPLMVGGVDADPAVRAPVTSLVAATSDAPDPPEPHPRAEPRPEPPAVDPMQAAASRGEVLDAGAWWVAPLHPEDVDWHAAAGRCRRARIAGSSGFHLPSRGQLWALVRASALPRGRYWTRSLARGESQPSNWVFDSEVGHMVPQVKDGEARSVCIRVK